MVILSSFQLIVFIQVLRSIGYRSLPLNGTVPFDNRRGVIANSFSRVSGEKGEQLF